MQLYYVNLREGISIYKILWFMKNESFPRVQNFKQIPLIQMNIQ